MHTFTPEELATARKAGNFILLATPAYPDEAKEGVAYREWLSGPDGMGFALLREPHHTDEYIMTAKRWLLDRRDVAYLFVYRPAKT